MASDDLRVGGLLSNTDVQGIIDKILALRARQVTNKQQEIEGINEKIAAWADINTHMSDLTESLDTLRTWETWNQMTAISSDETKLTASATTAAINATYYITTNHLAQSHCVGSDRASDLSIGATSTTDLVAAGVLTAGDEFSIEGQTITIGATESLDTLKDKINLANSGIPTGNQVVAAIMDHRLVISRVNTGNTELTMTETTGSPLQDLGVFSAPATFKAANVLMNAQDAEFAVNGAIITRTKNVGLTDVITGVTLNLHDTTASSLTLKVEQHKEVAHDAILNFIEKYNGAVTTLNSYGGISINSTSLGSSISSVGMLSDDPLVQEIMRNMRKLAMESKYPYLNNINASYTYNGATGVCDSLQTIGISTSSQTNSISTTDGNRLDYMLENNFEKVAQLFRGVYDAVEGYQHGIATDFHKYSQSISASMTGAIARRDARLDEQVVDIEESIERMLDLIEKEESRLWAQFSAMEDAIATMQSQLSYLTSQLGG